MLVLRILYTLLLVIVGLNELDSVSRFELASLTTCFPHSVKKSSLATIMTSCNDDVWSVEHATILHLTSWLSQEEAASVLKSNKYGWRKFQLSVLIASLYPNDKSYQASIILPIMISAILTPSSFYKSPVHLLVELEERSKLPKLVFSIAYFTIFSLSSNELHSAHALNSFQETNGISRFTVNANLRFLRSKNLDVVKYALQLSINSIKFSQIPDELLLKLVLVHGKDVYWSIREYLELIPNRSTFQSMLLKFVDRR
jgi:hypothetical protein